MGKATQVPSNTWQKKVTSGVDENGEKTYEVLYGDSEEDVEKKAREYAKKKKFAYMNKWQGENKERMSVVFNKGTRERIESLGCSLNGFIREAVEKELKARGV